MLPDLKTPLLWILGLAFVAALATAGVERTRAAGARADAATARKELADLRATNAESGRQAERAARTQEQTWRERLEGVTQNGRNQIAAARVDAERAGAAERLLRDQLASYRAAVRAATAAAGPAGGSPPAEAALDLLADLLGRSGAALGELGRFADAAHAAGTICERAADATAP
ncbi:hypothetical protein FHT32_004724 [Variovorax sp. SG517]|uniref:DUF2514 family protein n=1 Tax=Variovorax sp. SG517 TaxID=2587117 RepID=UPI00159D3035|nr:DUF2514 family protein [Variovorax sp. SG517]NVM91060.1 hypothetical protein [Variovorax sp. SG517]